MNKADYDDFVLNAEKYISLTDSIDRLIASKHKILTKKTFKPRIVCFEDVAKNQSETLEDEKTVVSIDHEKDVLSSMREEVKERCAFFLKNNRDFEFQVGNKYFRMDGNNMVVQNV